MILYKHYIIQMKMEKILTSLERDAKTIIEETGSNMLYLILGLLNGRKLKIQMNISISPLITIPIILNKEKKTTSMNFH